MTLSTTRKKIDEMTTMMNTMLVVIMVSRRVGQVTSGHLGAHLADEFDRIVLSS